MILSGVKRIHSLPNLRVPLFLPRPSAPNPDNLCALKILLNVVSLFSASSFTVCTVELKVCKNYTEVGNLGFGGNFGGFDHCKISFAIAFKLSLVAKSWMIRRWNWGIAKIIFFQNIFRLPKFKTFLKIISPPLSFFSTRMSKSIIITYC